MTADPQRSFPSWDERYQQQTVETMPWFYPELDDDLKQALGANTAVLMLTQVNFRTGAIHDMAALTAAAHAAGALAIWDLSHSAGAVPVDLNGARADFAIGCGYKYLNGGPGAPAFVYAAARHQGRALQPLYGWFGHAAPFEFAADYVPAEGIRQYLCSTPSILALAALEESVDLFAIRSADGRAVEPLDVLEIASRNFAK